MRRPGPPFAAGPVAFLTIGWIVGLRAWGDWILAAVMTIAIYSAACILALVLLVIISWHPA